jgi:anthranilate/para-aminobenzoate synthase component I
VCRGRAVDSPLLNTLSPLFGSQHKSLILFGYCAFDGRIDLNVAIRTISFKDSVARLNVGGAIVADSDPAEEDEESLLKAKALLAALRNFEF